MKKIPMRVWAVALFAALLVPALVTSAASAATSAPDAIFELQKNADGKTTRFRTVVPAPPAAAVAYDVNTVDAQGRESYRLQRCPVSAMRNGSGANGCWTDISPGFGGLINLRWVDKSGARSPATRVYIEHVPTMSLNGRTFKQNTIEQIFVQGTAASAGRMFFSLRETARQNAVACLKDQAVTAALEALKKAAGKAATTNTNPYTVAGAVIATTVVKMDAKVFSNRCQAIANAAQAFVRAHANAVKTGKPSRVYLTSVWAKDATSADNCVLFTSSGGGASVGGDGSAPKQINTRPPGAGGPNESQCLHFWDSVAS